MLNEKLRPIIEPVTTGIGRALARAGISPNGLTTIGLLAMIGASSFVFAGRTVLAGVLLIPAFLLDVLDGALARATGRVTAWGGFYDSVCDRIADGVLFGAFIWLARGQSARAMAAAMSALAISLMVPYARAKAESLGYAAASGLGERAERAVVVCAGLILGYEEAAMWVIVGLTAWTFVGRVVGVRRQALAGRS